MGKLTVNSSFYTIINIYKNAPIASGYYAGIYLIRNEVESDNSNSIFEAAYL